MGEGKILVAKHEGVYVLRFIGDVRLTLCTALDIFLSKVVEEPNLPGVIIDLTQTEAIDSTSLGFIAKISILTKKKFQWLPTLISTNPDITRLLMSMGFDQVFDIVRQPIDQDLSMQELEAIDASESQVKGRVLEAHKILMGLNESNCNKFQELVDILEQT